MTEPFFSILTPVYEPPLDVLRETIESVLAQSFTDWELILVDDRSPSDAVRFLLHEFEERDPRIRVIERPSRGGIAHASNDALAAARGTFVALLDHDDLLAPHALESVAAVVADDVDYIYTDEDKLGPDGRFFDTFRKPDWSPERFRHQMYTCHLSVLRTELVRQVGGFRPEFDGSQDYDLVLRVTEKARRVVHIPDTLYHWRMIPGSAAADPHAKPYAYVAAQRALQEHLDRLNIKGSVEIGPAPGTYRIKRTIDPRLRVSIIVPTRGASGEVWGEHRVYVVEALRSALEHTHHDSIEVIVVYDVETSITLLEELKTVVEDKLILVAYDEPFNFSRKCNRGFIASSGDVVVLLNDDIEVISDDWITELVAPLTEMSVGMTGAYLLYENSSIQHAGHVYGAGVWTHAYHGISSDNVGSFCDLLINRECVGVTAACCALRREVYEQVGGLCEKLPGNYNDVDLSYKVRKLGYRVLWIANARLFHFESRTRTDATDIQQWERDFVARRWGIPEGEDPYLRIG
ncbi:MAG: glycosyltransferase [Acidothermus sp.]|nr:glycosyltransferase [Acidothermus sp.]